ncbi:DUF998 domain-containing protein [Geomicrobium sp. JCM 19038]|uniref:DUF998 domain-containing protein n=1 Tax=Geomicrobium sp. JCM 19038 TaxID=1460635 RepID=UPI00045F3A45|nr:DUF998 domain-containing protein [Geomicrobium sp. JCM 19038]GAK08125.1 hypothetical protein JCM19038_1896 [Geomicrobium sp. JCM 19038]
MTRLYWIGISAWFISLVPLLYEPIPIAASPVPYYYMIQPMSDLGVTVCKENAYPMVHSLMICSPHHVIVNVLFTLSGVAYLVGAFVVRQFVPERLPFVLLLLFAVGAIISGLIPANVNFTLHTIPALAMFLVPILIGIYAKRVQVGRAWNWSIFTIMIMIFIGMVLTVFFPIGGLIQRSFMRL